ncbi:MAG: hypothetical protein V3U75_11605 [Methylococcaceae bacterium]
MSDSKEPGEECEGMRQARETDKEIKEILKQISAMNTDNSVNAANLTHITGAYKELATANSLTHYKLFSRTEKLKVSMGKLETRHSEHIKHGTAEGNNRQHRHVVLVSWVAIGISLTATIVFGLIQAGVFN